MKRIKLKVQPGTVIDGKELVRMLAGGNIVEVETVEHATIFRNEFRPPRTFQLGGSRERSYKE